MSRRCKAWGLDQIHRELGSPSVPTLYVRKEPKPPRRRRRSKPGSKKDGRFMDSGSEKLVWFWLCSLFLTKLTALILHVLLTCNRCTVFPPDPSRDTFYPSLSGSGPREAVCINGISGLPFPLAWLPGGSSTWIGGRRKLRLRYLFHYSHPAGLRVAYIPL